MTDVADDFQILRLRGSYEVFGVVLDFLAGMEPFRRYEFGALARAVQKQLHDGEHLAAMTRGRMIGYAGWLPSTEAIARRWLDGDGEIAPLARGVVPDTAIVTIVAAGERRVAFALGVRLVSINTYPRIFYKRDYAATGRTPRKRVVELPAAGSPPNF
jgi:hypothetical protein